MNLGGLVVMLIALGGIAGLNDLDQKSDYWNFDPVSYKASLELLVGSSDVAPLHTDVILDPTWGTLGHLGSNCPTEA